VVVDAHGLPVRLLLTPDQASDKTTFAALINGLPLARDVVADRGFFARAIIDLIEAAGARAHIPSQSNVRVPRVVDLAIYRCPSWSSPSSTNSSTSGVSPRTTTSLRETFSRLS
jgi:transposase